MNSNSNFENRIRPGVALRIALATGLLTLIAAACVSVSQREEGGGRDARERGFIFSHATHLEQGLDDCTICHDTTTNEDGILSAPAHELCSVCHEVPEFENNLPATPEDAEKCQYCHTREDFSVTDWAPRLSAELRWQHEAHTNAELDCATCHENPDKRGGLPKGSLKPVCMDCHGAQSPALNACSVCHSEVSETSIPKFRNGQRIAHDQPAVWEKVHGQEARVSAAYCALCHDEEESCNTCHSQKPPQDHTLSWKRKTHGILSSWDRNRCAACHEDDFCIKCHQNNAPSSHRAGWGAPLNRHCTTCHFPPERTNCTVCHQDIRHESARPSPHSAAIFPPDCARCHPGGLPQLAPHARNSTVQCSTCHL